MDEFGHGTHVAGIIAGEQEGTRKKPIYGVTRYRDKDGEVTHQLDPLPRMSGMAPRCKLLSLKVLDEDGKGVGEQPHRGDPVRPGAQRPRAALSCPRRQHERRLRLRARVVRLRAEPALRRGRPAGALGRGGRRRRRQHRLRLRAVAAIAAPTPAGLGLTINDPGNADLAITVGSTHRDMPHIYGVSYFSSKGPTGDGRDKPDLVAPGEKILSCGRGQARSRRPRRTSAERPDYVEDSGTSMAAPHVSGVIAAFLSIRREFIGQPERVKEIFLSTATDLRRDRYFQGTGLVDLMRAIQSV